METTTTKWENAEPSEVWDTPDFEPVFGENHKRFSKFEKEYRPALFFYGECLAALTLAVTYTETGRYSWETGHALIIRISDDLDKFYADLNRILFEHLGVRLGMSKDDMNFLLSDLAFDLLNQTYGEADLRELYDFPKTLEV